MGRILYKCEFGHVHKTGNCRCMSTHTDTRQIKCDVPEIHGAEKVVSKSLKSRLEETVDGFFGNMVMAAVKESLVNQIEKDVINWLRDNANDELRRTTGKTRG